MTGPSQLKTYSKAQSEYPPSLEPFNNPYFEFPSIVFTIWLSEKLYSFPVAFSNADSIAPHAPNAQHEFASP